MAYVDPWVCIRCRHENSFVKKNCTKCGIKRYWSMSLKEIDEFCIDLLWAW